MSETFENRAQGRLRDKQAQIQGHTDADRVQLLSDELDDFLTHATEENADVDKLDGILSALEQASPLPEGDAFDPKAGLARFHERLASDQTDESKDAAENDFVSSSLTRSKRRSISRVLLIAAILTLVLATAASSSRYDFFGQFTRWTEEVFGFETHEPQVAEITRRPLAYRETREYASVQELLDDFGITGPLFPTWVPERFGEPVVIANNSKKGLTFQIDYGTDTEQLHIRVREITSNMRDTEKDYSDVDIWRIHGVDFYFMSDENDGRSFDAEKVAWQNGVLECKLYGTVIRKEMKQIIQSVYEGE